MSRHRMPFAAALGVLAVSLALPATTLANTGFRVAADRSSVMQGVSTTVGVSITPDDQDDVDNRCYGFQLPPAFVVQGAQITAAPGGSNWTAVVQPGGVALRSSGDPVIGPDERLAAAITLIGTTPGAYTWTVGGYDNTGCGGGPDVQRTLPMTIAPSGPPPTPPPTPTPPTPAPTPVPTPKPPPVTARPTATPPSARGTGTPTPIVSPTPPGPASPGSSDPGPSPSGSGAASVADSAQVGSSGPTGSGPNDLGSGSPRPSEDGAPVTTAPGTGIDNEPATPLVRLSDGASDGSGLSTQITSSVLSAMAMLDNPFQWFVPGLAVGVPGMLIVVVLGAQVVGGIAWIPTVRRSLREEERRHRPLRPGWL